MNTIDCVTKSLQEYSPFITEEDKNLVISKLNITQFKLSEYLKGKIEDIQKGKEIVNILRNRLISRK